ncbi:MAG TPA: SurA N-terminal domain-containing protein [Syntrophobacteria bacterium]|nr:SurA N-terminal domain-containing protein [Syntrophobacteria bacterium]
MTGRSRMAYGRTNAREIMLDLMRKHATSWLIKVFLFAIVIVFIFWGGYSYREQRAGRLASVNGSYIDLREYQQTYNNLVERVRQQMGGRFSSELLETMKLKEQALNQLITRRLLLDEAHRLGLEVRPEELQQAILGFPDFQINGRFDPEQYQRTVRALRLTTQEFEARQREDMLIQRLAALVGGGASVLPAEASSFYHHFQDKVNLAYVMINPASFTDQVKPDGGAISRYFVDHRESYRLPATRKIVYVRFSPRDYLDEVKPTEGEIGDYYRLHQDEYQQPKKVRARHILFRIPPNATTPQIQAVVDRAKTVLNQAQGGEDFAALARKYSEDTSAANGGDLGYFSEKDMEKPFAQAAFSLKKGEMSDLVRTRFGIHIIKVEDIREGVSTPLADVRERVITALKQEKAADIARDRARSFADAARVAEDLNKAAAAEHLQTKEAGSFAANAPIPGLGSAPDLNKALFSLQLKDISRPLTVGQDQIVAQIVEIDESRLPEFDEAKEKVTTDWIAEEGKRLARQRAEEVLKVARQEGDLAGVARRYGLNIVETGPFTFFSPAPALGNNRELLTVAFALTPEHPLAPEPFDVKGNILLIQLRSREPAPQEQAQDEKDALAERLREAKQESLFQRWLTSLRQQADIKVLQKL